MAEFRMPSLGADMDVGTIVEWLVKPGDAVHRGQIVAVVDTAKAAIEIEAFEEGVLEEILIGVGVQVPVGTPLAMIGASGGAGAEGAGGGAGAGGAGAGEGADGEKRPGGARPGRGKRGEGSRVVPAHPRATPPIRHLAHQLGVDLDQVAGSGPDGRITHDDLLHATPSPDLRQDPGRFDARNLDQPPESLPKPAASPPGVGRLRVSPRARRLAAERGIDVGEVAGSGAQGAISGADLAHVVPAKGSGAGIASAPASGVPGAVAGGGAAPGAVDAADAATPARAAGSRPPGGAATSPDPKAAMRTAIANLMSRSNAEIPHYYVSHTMDLAAALAWLESHNAELPAARRVLPAALFLRATVLAAGEVPDLNGHWIDGALNRSERVDLGVAVATRGGGLVTPALPDVGQMRIDELMAALVDLVGRARRGKLRQSQMAGASITVSSLGETGPDALFGVIFPPQVALVGVGGIVERPWAVAGMLAVRPTVTITLAADHRASDGRTASAFLATFDRALQNPEEL